LLLPGRLVDRRGHVRLAPARGESGGEVGGREGRSRRRIVGTHLMPQPVTSTPGRRLISSGDLDLVIAECPKGIGSVIGSPPSPELLSGVPVPPVPLHPDDRGYFLEVQRIGNGLAAAFPSESTQISAAVSYPGTVKASHFHLL